MFEYDMVIIGGGPGGISLALDLGAAGQRVAIVEGNKLGGACVNAGCIPKKLFVHASESGASSKSAAAYGWPAITGKTSLDWNVLARETRNETQRLRDIYAEKLEFYDVEVIRGFGQVAGPNEVIVGRRRITAAGIVIATGSAPFIPDISGMEHIRTSNDVFDLEKLPQEVVIWGGGYIGVEIAGILNGLGVETTVVFREELPMKGFDGKIRQHLEEDMSNQGIRMLAHENVASVEKCGNGYRVKTETGLSLSADLVVATTGRKPVIHGIGLEEIGVKISEWGTIEVNDRFRTVVPSIYAIGDVIGTPQLAPVAMAQAKRLANIILGVESETLDYDLIPTAVFSQPNVASVGLTEEQAREKYPSLSIFETWVQPVDDAIPKTGKLFCGRLIVDCQTDRVVGIHLAGDGVGEIIQGLALAVKLGATKSDFDNMISVHPTMTENLFAIRHQSYGYLRKE